LSEIEISSREEVASSALVVERHASDLGAIGVLTREIAVLNAPADTVPARRIKSRDALHGYGAGAIEHPGHIQPRPATKSVIPQLHAVDRAIDAAIDGLPVRAGPLRDAADGEVGAVGRSGE
jgi:hypothetical protein